MAVNPFQQTQKLLAKMEEIQNALEKKEAEGSSGAGLVSVVLNGKNDVVKIHIDPSLLVPEAVEMLEDLVTAAFRDARQKIEEIVSEEGRKISAGLPKIPGMPLF